MITITLKDATEQHLVTVALRRQAADVRNLGLRIRYLTGSEEAGCAMDKKADILEQIADHVEEA